MGRFTSLRYCLLVGGQSMESQFEVLVSNPDVIVATPGRLLHQLMQARHSMDPMRLHSHMLWFYEYRLTFLLACVLTLYCCRCGCFAAAALVRCVALLARACACACACAGQVHAQNG